MNFMRGRASLSICSIPRLQNTCNVLKTKLLPAATMTSKRLLTGKDLRKLPVAEKYRSSSMDILDNMYSKEVAQLILDKINNFTPEQLNAKVTRTLAPGILSTRPFEKISDMLEIPNSDAIKISRLCDAMKKVKRTALNYRTDRFTLNKLTIEKMKTIKTITTLHHDFRGAHWFTMTTDNKFIEMNSYELETVQKYRHDLQLDLFAEQVQDLVDRLPPSDIIVMCERVKTKAASKLIGQLENSLKVLDGALFGLMLGRQQAGMVTTLKFNVLNKTFNLTFGEDMISVAAKVQNILDSGQINGQKIQNLQALKSYFRNSDESKDARVTIQERQSRLVLTHISFNNQVQNALLKDATKTPEQTQSEVSDEVKTESSDEVETESFEEQTMY